MNWWNREPTSLWVLAGPTLMSAVFALQLASSRPDKFIPALLLGASVGLITVVLAQHWAARRKRATHQLSESEMPPAAGGGGPDTERGSQP